MNANHYPSLDRCKKLTEIGFPNTEKSWNCDKAFIGDENLYAIQRSESPSVKAGYSIDLCVCPSVMEMVDVIADLPNDFTDHWALARNLPNTLADLIIWLVENSHLTFDKR